MSGSGVPWIHKTQSVVAEICFGDLNNLQAEKVILSLSLLVLFQTDNLVKSYSIRTPALLSKSFAFSTDILPEGRGKPSVSPLGVNPSPSRSTKIGLL